MEAALGDRIDAAEFSVYRARFRNKGELQCLIDLGGKKRMFTDRARGQAHQIRKFGNDVMHPKHGREASDDETWQTLQKIRFILEELCT